MSARRPYPFFLELPERGRRLCVHYAAAGPRCRGALIHVAALMEEMNKSRRMVALTARSLAEAGFDVLVPDLLGCGDSDGSSEDATWQSWLEDLRAMRDWLARSAPASPVWLWGHRGGCLLAAEAVRTMPDWGGVLCWQPQSNGMIALQQLLRLAAVGQMLEGQGKQIVTALRRDIDEGRVIEVAGYRLNPLLLRGLAQARLAPPTAGLRASMRVCWLELSGREDAEPLPATREAAAVWNGAGISVQLQTCSGPAFWQTTEIEDAPNLIKATVQAMLRSTEAESLAELVV